MLACLPAFATGGLLRSTGKMGQIPPAGNDRVPCLHDGGFQVRESIVIAEYLASATRRCGRPMAGHAPARRISAEMHAGYVALRTAMPMNLKLRLRGRPARVEAYRGWVSVFSVRSIMRTSGGDPEQTVEPSLVWRLVTARSGRTTLWPTASFSAIAVVKAVTELRQQ